MKRTRRRRKPAMDFAPRVDAEAWLQEHPDALIDCPHQPGNLRLTREACAKRHQTANQPRWNNLSAEPHAVFMFKMNLIPCRACQVGARLAAGEVSWRRAAPPGRPPAAAGGERPEPEGAPGRPGPEVHLKATRRPAHWSAPARPERQSRKES